MRSARPELRQIRRVHFSNIVIGPMKNFPLIGVAGYIAPRHLKATKDNLVATWKKSNPHKDFFTERRIPFFVKRSIL